MYLHMPKLRLSKLRQVVPQSAGMGGLSHRWNRAPQRGSEHCQSERDFASGESFSTQAAEAAPPLTREEKRACQAASVGGGPRCHVHKHGPRCPRPRSIASPNSHNPWVHPLPPLQGAANEGEAHTRNASSHSTKPSLPCCTRREPLSWPNRVGDLYLKLRHLLTH